MTKLLSWWKNYAFYIMLIVMVIGLKYPAVMLIFIICMFAPLLTGAFTGRFWCGNLCPIGLFFDNVLIKISNTKKVPGFFRTKWIRIIITTFMMSMFVYEVLLTFGKPHMIGMVYYEMILEATIIGTFLSVIYHHRAWCHICPMGSTGALVTHYSKRKKVLSVSSNCTECGKCEKNCPMGVAPYVYKGTKLESYNCIQCGNCTKVCTNQCILYQTSLISENMKLIEESANEE